MACCINNNEPNQPVFIEKILRNYDKLGFKINYDPESNKISLWAKLPKTSDCIEIILPYDFDINFFLPQSIEVNYLFGIVKKNYFILAYNIEDMINQIKKIIIDIIASNNDYGFEILRPLTGKSKIFGDFTFIKENNIFIGSISFNRGDVNILILPST